MNNANPINKPPLDPFAVDFFGVKSSPLNEEEKISGESGKEINMVKGRKTENVSVWHENLPRLTAAEVEFSNKISSLPLGLTKKATEGISEIIARYTFQLPEEVKFSTISVSEVNMAASLGQPAESSSMTLTINCQPDNSPALISFDTDFAASMINLILGVKTYEPIASHQLSPIEKTIIEFLGIKILSEINAWLGEDILFLQAVDVNRSLIFDPYERGTETIIRLDLGAFSGTIRFYSAWNFLSGLDKNQNPLYGEKPAQERLKILDRSGIRLNFRIPVGRTSLDSESISFLEPGDIILVEQTEINLKNKVFPGKSQIYLGSGKNFWLSGEIIPPDTIDCAPDGLNFRINERVSWAPPQRELLRTSLKTDKKEMQNTEQEEMMAALESESPVEDMGSEQEENLSALENILVSLRIEMAGNRISLRELQNLHPGQIIALGCRPTDPVRLITDNSDQPIAMGELIDIEGELGVRLTRIFI